MKELKFEIERIEIKPQTRKIKDYWKYYQEPEHKVTHFYSDDGEWVGCSGPAFWIYDEREVENHLHDSCMINSFDEYNCV